jgi:hypothetical protein
MAPAKHRIILFSLRTTMGVHRVSPAREQFPSQAAGITQHFLRWCLITFFGAIQLGETHAR